MELTSRERVLNALAGRPVDRLPVISVCQYATYDLMNSTGAYWPEAHRDGAVMAALARGGADCLGLDAVRVPFCQTVEAEIFGAEIDDGGSKMIPSVRRHALKIGDPVSVPDDLLERGRIPAVLDAIRLLKSSVGADTAVMGSLVGPFSSAAGMLGITPLLKASLRTPDALIPYLEAAEKTAALYAEAMLEAGADVIVVEDMMASLDIISPRIYKKVAFGWEQKLIADIKAPVILHICGKLDLVMDALGETGAAALSVEQTVDIKRGLELFEEAGHNVRFIGAVDPVSVLLMGSPDDVRAASASSIEKGVAAVSPGCAVPPNTPLENLLAMTEHK